VQRLGDHSRAIVSEPLDDLPEAWIEVPPSTALIIQPDDHAQIPFTPQSPS
jgi:glutamine amidotransferase